MTIFLGLVGGLFAYLLMTCVMATVLIKLNPFDINDDDDDRTGVWICSTAWPFSFPAMLLLGFMVNVLVPIIVFVCDVMGNVVDWATKPKVKVKLPRMEIRK